ncbi:hypothetical protein MTO96_034342, partial [Rhipicephalus appendiculatus]
MLPSVIQGVSSALQTALIQQTNSTDVGSSLPPPADALEPANGDVLPSGRYGVGDATLTNPGSETPARPLRLPYKPRPGRLVRRSTRRRQTEPRLSETRLVAYLMLLRARYEADLREIEATESANSELRRLQTDAPRDRVVIIM